MRGLFTGVQPYAKSGPSWENWRTDMQKVFFYPQTVDFKGIVKLTQPNSQDSKVSLYKDTFLWVCEIWGNFMQNWYFVNNYLIKVWI